MVRSFLRIVVLVSTLFLAVLSKCHGECEKKFDAILCDSRSRGIAFKGKDAWSIECHKDYINVLENSHEQLEFTVTASFSDGQFAYLFNVSVDKLLCLFYRKSP